MKTKDTNKPVFIGRLSGLLCWPHGHDIENRSAQPYSRMSKFRKNQALHFLHELHGEEMYSAQSDSKICKSILSLSPQRPQRLNRFPAQPYSRMSNLWFWCSTRPSRTVDFGTSHLRAKATTAKVLLESSPAQLHSKFSKWGNRPLSPLCLFSPLDTNNLTLKTSSGRRGNESSEKPGSSEKKNIQSKPVLLNHALNSPSLGKTKHFEEWDGRLKWKKLLLNGTLNSPSGGIVR